MSEPAPLRALLWSEAAFLTGVLLHVGRLPLWAMVTAFVCAAWALAARTRRVALPGPVLRSVFALALLAVVLAMFRTLNGLAAGTALLVLTGSVKLLEASTRRDRYIVIGAALFLVLAASLEQQSLACVPLYALATWLSATALLVSAHPESSLGNADAARLAARSLVAALPLAVLLFLFFPRLAGSFWAIP